MPVFLRVCALVIGCLAAGTLHAQAADKQDFSVAERLIFMNPQLQNVSPPATLRYAFRKTGSLEAGFDDRVALQLTRQDDGACCAAKSEFLSGERRLVMPDLPAAEANPVILYFLEHDVREMQRLTKGSQNHFRKRIRMAVYAGAAVRDLELPFQGRLVKGREVRLSPYLDDPNRSRFDKLARKEYRFLLADAVPGGVYGIRTQISDPAPGAAPLLVEELWIDGADAAALRASP